MPTITDTAICIRRWDFSETSQTVSVFTREHGVIRGIAKGAKRERGMFGGGLDVLTRGRVVAIVKPGRDLATFTAWHLEETWRVLRHRLEANRAGLYIADLVHHMVTEHDPHPRLFDALAAALDGLGETPAGRGERAAARAVMLAFQWRLLEETGYRPEVERDVETGAALDVPDGGASPALAFSPRAGGIVMSAAGPDRWRVRRSTVDLLRRLAAGQAIEGADAQTVERANRLLAAYVREVIGEEVPTWPWAFPNE